MSSMSDRKKPVAFEVSSVDQSAIEKAVDLYESEGALRCTVDEEMVLLTLEHRVWLHHGICVAASVAALEGAVLVGWLLSMPRVSGVGAWWRRGARAVFLLRRSEEKRIIVVTDEVMTLEIGGDPVYDGYATQARRFVACHSKLPPPAVQGAPSKPPRAAPASKPPPNAWALRNFFDDVLDEEEATEPRCGRPNPSIAPS
jgi:hypothetical protein